MIDYEGIRSFAESLILPLILAVLGGVARACRFGVQNWRKFCGSIFVSAFTGVVVFLLLEDAGISQSALAGIVAASGYSGTVILDGIVDGLKHRAEKICKGE